MLSATFVLVPSAALAQVTTSPVTGIGLGGLSNSSTSSLIIDQQRQDRLPAAPIPQQQPLQAPPTTIPEPSQTAPNTMLTQVRLIGSTLPPAQMKAAWQGYVGKPLNGANIQALAAAISAAYGRSDVALYTIVIPRQTMGGGELIIQATEGYLTNVLISGNVAAPNIRLIRRYAAKLTAEKPLLKHSLERYLSLTRDIPGLSLDAQMHATDTPGGVVLALDLKQKRFQAELAISDNGSPRLGGTQAQGALTINGAITAGDQLRVTVAAPPAEPKLFQYYSASYAAHLGTDGMTVTGSLGELYTKPKDSSIKGQDTVLGVTFNYPLWRSYQENLYLSWGLDGQNSDNAAFGQNLYSDHTRALRGSFSWTKATPTRVLAASATASLGLNILGAAANPLLTNTAFDKLNGQVGLDQALGKTWVVRLRGTGQGSWGLLPGAEQFSLGGDQFGRAFPSAYVLGDFGAAGSAELGWRSATLWPHALAGSELYTFVDGGSVTSRPRVQGLLPLATYDLSSTGVGVRFDFIDKVVIGLEGAKALVTPLPGPAPWRVLVSWRSTL
jgi:hemolysin activation/secretion protein